MAEAHNAAGNDAFNAGNFPKAVTHYYEAVKADGKVAKYRTNLANALLKSGRCGTQVHDSVAAGCTSGSLLHFIIVFPGSPGHCLLQCQSLDLQGWAGLLP
jgi:hypothetical protein